MLKDRNKASKGVVPDEAGASLTPGNVRVLYNRECQARYDDGLACAPGYVFLGHELVHGKQEQADAWPQQLELLLGKHRALAIAAGSCHRLGLAKIFSRLDRLGLFQRALAEVEQGADRRVEPLAGGK